MLAIISAMALVLALAASAHASSIVYIHAGNVWLANPDGSGQYQVTLDGSAAEPYSSPSQAQDGTIEAVRGQKLYRMTQNGTLLNAPFATSAVGSPPLDPQISPDGTKTSFWSTATFLDCAPWLCDLYSADSYQVTYSDHWVDPATFVLDVYGLVSYSSPAWLGNSRELVPTRNGYLWYYTIGSPEPVQWFEWNEVLHGEPGVTGYWDEAAASADGTRLALLALDEQAKQFQIQVYSAAGDLATANPPALPHPYPACDIHTPDGSVGTNDGTYKNSGWLFDSLSWSPDDSALAFEYNSTIYVAHINLENCQETTVTPVIGEASDPNWGPANVNPAPRPAPPAAPAPPPVLKPLAPPPPCAGTSGTSAQECHAKLEYRKALSACAHKYAGHGKHARRQRAACRRKANAAYHRKLALIKCQKLENRHARTQCVKKAKRS
jgi:hypothetical protein